MVRKRYESNSHNKLTLVKTGKNPLGLAFFYATSLAFIEFYFLPVYFSYFFSPARSLLLLGACCPQIK